MENKIKNLIRSTKFKRISLIIGSTLLFYSLLGFLIIPAIVSNQAPKLVQEKFNRELLIADIQFNPFSMEINIKGFELQNLDNTPFISFKNLYLNLEVLQSLANLTLTLEQIALNQPYALLKRNQQGEFNFTDMLGQQQPDQTEKKDDALFPLNITKITISEGKISWEDDLHSKPRREDITPLNLSIDNFTTLVNEQSQLRFSVKIASGGKLDWQGEIQLSPLQSSGHIKLDKVNFHKVWELFLQDAVNFEILKGSELIAADYTLTDTDQGLQLLLSSANIHLYDIQLSEKGKTKPVITIPDFKVSEISFNLLQKNIEISKISATKAYFKTWITAEGNINYQALFAAGKEPEKTTQQTDLIVKKEDKSWHIVVKELALSDFSVDFTDHSLANPSTINLSSLNLDSTQLSNNSGASLPFNLAVKINNKGTLKLKGKAILEPFSSNIQINLANIAIKDFKPYYSDFLNLDIISGLLNVTANVSLLQEKNQEMAIHIKGDSSIDTLITRNPVTNKDFLNWKQLQLSKIDLDLVNNSYSIDSVKINQPYVNVLIKKDKTTNIDDILVQTKSTPGNSKSIEPKGGDKKAEPSFKISHFKVINGISDFSDRSLILPFSVHISHLKGNIKGISSKKNAQINIDLKGHVANLAPVTITGKISPYRGDSEFDLNFNSMPLPIMTPYMAEFAGRKIEKGNMTLDLKYKIENKQLAASNSLLIDQLVLGDEVENPEAVSLPLGLAIALLQDADGKIALDVPITGDLDHPEFSVASIIIDALFNVITKIVTSPFYAIASLLNSEEDISKVTFLAGTALLDETQQEKLNQLANALSKRPALRLEIKGSAFSELDWPTLQSEALEKQIMALRLEELNKDSEKKIASTTLVSSDENYKRLLADLFIQNFPNLAERSLFGTPRLIDSEQGDFYEIAQTSLAATIPADIQRLQSLAVNRAQTIARHLVDKEIKIERIFLLDVAVDPEDSEKTNATTLSLTTG